MFGKRKQATHNYYVAAEKIERGEIVMIEGQHVKPAPRMKVVNMNTERLERELPFLKEQTR